MAKLYTPLPFLEAIKLKEADLKPLELNVLRGSNTPEGTYTYKVAKQLYGKEPKASEKIAVGRAVQRLVENRYIRQYAKADEPIYSRLKHRIKKDWKEGTPILRVNLFRFYLNAFPEVVPFLTEEELQRLDAGFSLFEPILIHSTAVGAQYVVDAAGQNLPAVEWLTEDQKAEAVATLQAARWVAMDTLRQYTEKILATSKPSRLKVVKPVQQYVRDAEVKTGANAVQVFIALVVSFNNISSRALNGELTKEKADSEYGAKKKAILAGLE